MESMVNLFNGAYKNKTVLLTGNSGFKGSWLAYWLNKLGADVIGFSVDIPTEPSHIKCLGEPYTSFIYGDVCDINDLKNAFDKHKFDLVFHLAAQPLVRYSYKNPLQTFQTNVMGTANVLEVCRYYNAIKGIVVVTSDKCYENFENDRAYNETDRMGGYDPYSASKGCAELVNNSFRNSYFSKNDFGIKHSFILASARAGNVIGGGDWSEDRLIPDIVKNASKKLSTEIRNPQATRPWQHVLEPLSGYLLLGQNILEGNITVSDGWNFGPANNEALPVIDVLNKAVKIWPAISFHTPVQHNSLHEAQSLRLDCTKANTQLNWKPVWNTDVAINKTIDWYRKFYETGNINTASDLQAYVNEAKNLNYVWTK
jgi:CDP-glucose 4,6-dehydratase